MDRKHEIENVDDLSALAWVHDELRRSIESAHKALRRFVRESEAVTQSDVDAVDPTILRGARSHLHQGVGALELVGLSAAAQLLRASENAVQRLTARENRLTPEACDGIERSSFGLLDYLARMLAGKPVSPVALFPQYYGTQMLAGADRIHPADLWPHDWRWRDLPATSTPVRHRDEDTQTKVETDTLLLMRHPEDRSAANDLSDVYAGLANGVIADGRDRRLASLWQLASAFFEAQSHGLVPQDLYTKRVASRLLAQLRMVDRAPADGAAAEVSDRLAQDILFFCAMAGTPPASVSAPRLTAARQAWGLSQAETIDYTSSRLGRFDPSLITQAKKRVAAAKDTWSAVAADERHRVQGMADQFTLVAESLERLFPAGDTLGRALGEAIKPTIAGDVAPPPSLAMEVATALLYVDAALEESDFDSPGQDDRVRRLAARIEDVRSGATPRPLEPWMEELYRRVADRQTMGSVVQELRTSLGESEKAIDQFFRDPSKREVLTPVPGQLQAMRGVVSVLGLDQASHTILRMRDDVEPLLSGAMDADEASERGIFDRMAGNLSALGFMIDMVSVQPQMAKSLFRFDSASGTLQSVARRGGVSRESGFGGLDGTPTALRVEPRLVDQVEALALTAAHPEVPLDAVERDLDRLAHEAVVNDQPALAETMTSAKSALQDASTDDERRAVRAELAQAMADFVASTSEAMPLQPELAPLPTAHVPLASPTPTPVGETGLEGDDEMRAIFLEEARDVIDGARHALATLEHAPDDLTELTTVRRAFHTLKGSSRMVGLKTFGEAAWACEQLYNARLADHAHADSELAAFTNEALAYMAHWVDAIERGVSAGHDANVVREAADALRLQGHRQGLPLPKAPASAGQVGGGYVTPGGEVTMGAISQPMSLSGLETQVSPLGEADVGKGQEHPDLVGSKAYHDTRMSEFAINLDPRTVQGLPGDFSMPPAAPSALRAPEPSSAATPPAPLHLDIKELSRGAKLPPSPPRAGNVGDTLPYEPDAFAETQPHEGAAEEAAELEARQAAEAEQRAEQERQADEARRQEAERVAQAARAAEEAAHAEAARAEEARVASVEQERLAETGAADPAPEAEEAAAAQIVQVGDLRVGLPLYNIYVGEAQAQAASLVADLGHWSLDVQRPVGERAVALAHSLAGNSATVGFSELSQLARNFEHALSRSHRRGPGTPDEASLFTEVGDEIRGLVQQFAAGQLTTPRPELLARLAEHEAAMAATVKSITQAKPEGDDDIDAVDAIDAELFVIFEEEGLELLPRLAGAMRDWAANPADASGAHAGLRALHTIKGGARLAGAMRLGEMAHRLEASIEQLVARGDADTEAVETLEAKVDRLQSTFDILRGHAVAEEVDGVEEADKGDASAPEAAPAAPRIVLPIGSPSTAPAEGVEAVPAPVAASDALAEGAATVEPELALAAAQQRLASGDPMHPASAEVDVAPAPVPVPTIGRSLAARGMAQDVVLPDQIQWSRFPAAAAASTTARASNASNVTAGAVRVKAALLDRLVNHAGEVSITRSRIDADVAQLKGAIVDLTDNLDRMRNQLREIEVQAETQISARMEVAKVEGKSFDPLEMDRFTRFQELTRMLAESVNDVATVHRGLQRTVQSTEDQLAAQARLTRELQDNLLRTRMVEFDSLADRLYRVVRQTAKETGKQVRLDIVNGTIEIDRGVLERMVASFEHLLRNCITHGVETPAVRTAAGKDASGLVTITLNQEGNEVAIEVRDDGAGLDFERIRQRAISAGLIEAHAQPSEAELAPLIFTPGFTTATHVTELAGRGVGMDVVRNEVNALGGRVETRSVRGEGAAFKLVVPLTTAVTQVVMLRAGRLTLAMPSTLVEIVRRMNADERERAYASSRFTEGEDELPFYWLGALLQDSPRSMDPAEKSLPVVIVRSAQQRVAIHVDEVIGNQEVVVKNLGPQLSRVPGLAGITLLPSGDVVLIYNPVALANLYGPSLRDAPMHFVPGKREPEAPVKLAPLVLVVDDSLTVRRVTQRMLQREGYRVALAKDGLDGLEKLAEEKPAVLLSDIEMPRMDGFDLVRNLRGDARWRDLPVIMITSRIAEKHREHAMSLGVNHYLGKPYAEDELLQLIAHYTGVQRGTLVAAV